MAGTTDGAIRHLHLESFGTSQAEWQRKFDDARAGLKANVREVPGAEEPVLIEGGKYQGIWLESGPIDAQAYAPFDPAPYVAAHRLFFARQCDDGQIPCFVRKSGIGWSQVQTVTSIAVTALDCALHYADDDFLESAYHACSRWDDWLVRYRDSRGLGLCEAFCEYDTGHDNSPRWRGLPKICVDRDARRCPPDPRLPFLAPDLSASLYGGRLALAEMANRLGRPQEAAAWQAKAARTRDALFEHCYDTGTQCFYDRDAEGRFVQIVGDVLLRVLAEGVVGDSLFEQIFQRWVHHPEAFWPAFPMPSIAVCDAAFPRELPDNSWGGASQALTALRAPRWFERYGKFAELTDLMTTWLRGLAASDGFRQQADPYTGVFATTEDYSPAMCVEVDYMLRLQGITLSGRDALSWGCWYEGEDHEKVCVASCEQGMARLATRGGGSELFWCEQPVARVRGRARAVTDGKGRLRKLIGTQATAEEVAVEFPTGERQTYRLRPNQVIDLRQESAALEAARVDG